MNVTLTPIDRRCREIPRPTSKLRMSEKGPHLTGEEVKGVKADPRLLKGITPYLDPKGSGPCVRSLVLLIQVLKGSET